MSVSTNSVPPRYTHHTPISRILYSKDTGTNLEAAKHLAATVAEQQAHASSNSRAPVGVHDFFSPPLQWLCRHLVTLATVYGKLDPMVASRTHADSMHSGDLRAASHALVVACVHALSGIATHVPEVVVEVIEGQPGFG